MPRGVETEDRYKGSLVGGAVGDALGQPAEFIHLEDDQVKREAFLKELEKSDGVLREMMVNPFGYWGLGEYTDDTRQTLLLVDSLTTRRYDPQDIAGRLLGWFEHGKAKGLGNTTRQSLTLLESGVSWRESGEKAMRRGATLSNGSLMRTSPVGLYFRAYIDDMDRAAAEISRITHAHKEAVAACQIASALVGQLANGLSREDALAFVSERYASAFQQIMDAFYNKEQNPGGPYESLATALISFENARSFEEAVVEAVNVNLGGDTDTYGTVAGAFAGACWGVAQIPERWADKLNPLDASQIGRKAQNFYIFSQIDGIR